MTKSQKRHNILNIVDDSGRGRAIRSWFDERRCLAKRRIAHTEAGTDMLGQQFDGSAVGDRIGLC